MWDDEPLLRLSLKKLLENKYYSIVSTSGVEETLKLDPSLSFDLAIVDLNLKDGKGTHLISSLKKKQPHIQSILITGEHSINVTIVEAIKQEIFYFLPKPFEPVTLLNLVNKALKHNDLLEQNKHLRENIKRDFHFNQIIGQSPAVLYLTECMHKIAKKLFQPFNNRGKAVQEKSWWLAPFTATKTAPNPLSV